MAYLVGFLAGVVLTAAWVYVIYPVSDWWVSAGVVIFFGVPFYVGMWRSGMFR